MNNLYEISRRIMIEQKYNAVKNFSSFIKRQKKSRSVQRMIMLNYWVGSIAFLSISIILIYSRLLSGYSEIKFANIGFVIFVYGFLISVYNSMLLIQSVKSNYLLQPLKALPMKGNNMILFFCYLIFYGSSIAFLTVPSLIVYFLFTGNYYSLLFGSVWTLIMIFSGFVFGSLFAVISYKAIGKSARKSLKTIGAALKYAAIIGSLIVFEIVIYVPESISNFIPTLSGMARYYTFILNIPYSVFLVTPVYADLLIDLMFSIIYLSLFLLLGILLSRIAFERINNIEEDPKNKSIGKPPKTEKFNKSLVRKDLMLIVREPQNINLIMTPVIITLPIILSLYGGSGHVSALGVYYLLLTLVAFASSFYTIMGMVSENRGFPGYRILPVTDSEIARSKVFSNLIIFLFILVPVSVVSVVITSSPFIYLLILPLVLIFSFIDTSLWNASRLLKRIPSDSEVINMESFGGNLGFMKLFVFTLVFLLIPVFFLELISHIFSISLSQPLLPLMFYLLVYLALFSFLIVGRGHLVRHRKRLNEPEIHS